MGKRASEVIPGIGDTDPDLLEIYGRVARTGEPEHFETYVRSLDMWFAISVYSPRSEHFVAVFDVITDRKRAEEVLRTSEEKFRAYVEQAADAVFVHDSQGRFVDVNRWACESLGYSRAELLGMNVQEIEQDFSLESDRRAWSEIQPDQPFTLYGTHRRKDGTTFPVEIRYGSFELEGQRRYLGLVRNITRRLQAEETLRTQNDLLHMTGEIANLGGWEFDTDTGVGRWTEQVARIHELDLDEALNVALGLGFYTAESRPRIERAVNDAITKAIPFDLELEIITAKGSRKGVRTKGVPVIKDGKVVQVRGILQDISERKRTEASLEVSQARMEAIVKTAVDAIITIDDQDIVWSFNPAAEKIFGYSSEEIVGRNIALLMPSPPREQHLNYAARFKSTGESRVLGVDREVLALRKDGSTFPIELGVSEVQVHGIRMYVGILRDVSERKLAQDALRRSEQRYRRIVETAREGVWVHDVEGRTTFVNTRMAEMLGYSVGELEGRPVIDFVVAGTANGIPGLSGTPPRGDRRDPRLPVSLQRWQPTLGDCLGEPPEGRRRAGHRRPQDDHRHHPAPLGRAGADVQRAAIPRHRAEHPRRGLPVPGPAGRYPLFQLREPEGPGDPQPRDSPGFARLVPGIGSSFG